MNLGLNDAELAFQTDVRAFIDAHWPEAVRTAGGATTQSPAKRSAAEQPPRQRSAAEQHWYDALCAHGWSVPNWPVEHGGTGWTPTQHYVWDRETTRAECPEMSAFGARMLAPVIYTWGSPEQQAKFLAPIREARVQWCQGYSEPGAGSDLASLQTRAVRDGDHYVVNGAKTWTSEAHVAQWMFCLVRTDTQTERRQQGISFLLIDMASAGIEVHPILLLGAQHSVNSVTLTDVRVPVANLIGEENRGWTYAKGLLAHERTGIAGVAASQVRLGKLKRLAARESDGALAEDAVFQRKLQEVEIELLALEMTELRTLATVQEGGAPGPESSILKIKGTELQQRIADLQMEALGYYGLPYPDDLLFDNEGSVGPAGALNTVRSMLYGRAASIFGGSNEIQKNIIAKAVLGLGTS